MFDQDQWRTYRNRRERALVPAEAEFSFNQNSGRVMRMEIMSCGAGGLGLYKTEEGTLGMEDYICRSVLQPQNGN